MEIDIAKKKKVKAMNISFQAWIKDSGYIPDWLIEQLLIRLPPKFVFTFKLVSKKWLSIIVDPCFVKMYCSRALSLQKSQPWTFISRFGNVNHFKNLVDTYSSNFKWPSFYSLSLPRFPYPERASHFVYGVSNGFVLYNPGFSVFRICNPVTGHWISIPHNREKGYIKSDIFSTFCSFMTNVKDGVLMSYTVVCLLGSKGDQSKFITCYVFLSEVGEWKKYTMPVDIYINIAPYSSSAILDGVVHFEIRGPHLVAYDPHKHPDCVRIIALPCRNSHPSYRMCDAYHGKLRCFGSDCPQDDHFESFNIWVLNNYNSDEWCIQHRVHYGDIKICSTLSSIDLSCVGLMGFHPYDLDIVYMRYEGMIISYNIKTKKLEIPKEFEQLKEGNNIYETFGFLQTLMIPPWPISYSRPLLELH